MMSNILYIKIFEFFHYVLEIYWSLIYFQKINICKPTQQVSTWRWSDQDLEICSSSIFKLDYLIAYFIRFFLCICVFNTILVDHILYNIIYSHLNVLHLNIQNNDLLTWKAMKTRKKTVKMHQFILNRFYLLSICNFIITNLIYLFC
jgi:hypothetical protein